MQNVMCGPHPTPFPQPNQWNVVVEELCFAIWQRQENSSKIIGKWKELNTGLMKEKLLVSTKDLRVAGQKFDSRQNNVPNQTRRASIFWFR